MPKGTSLVFDIGNISNAVVVLNYWSKAECIENEKKLNWTCLQTFLTCCEVGEHELSFRLYRTSFRHFCSFFSFNSKSMYELLVGNQKMYLSQDYITEYNKQVKLHIIKQKDKLK